MAGNVPGKKRILEPADRYGVDIVQNVIDEVMNHSERLTRATISFGLLGKATIQTLRQDSTTAVQDPDLKMLFFNQGGLTDLSQSSICKMATDGSEDRSITRPIRKLADSTAIKVLSSLL
jgi:hypothetical protein